MIGQLLDFRKKYNHCRVSRNDLKFKELRQWVTVVRRSYRENKLYNFQVEQLEKIGFEFKEPGTTIHDLKEYETIPKIAKKLNKTYSIIGFRKFEA